MAYTTSHTRDDSVPRFPFQTPVLHQTACREPAVRSVPDGFQQPSEARSSRSTQPLNVITGFDNPRTPPPPGYTRENGARPRGRGHQRKESIQERRARAKAEEVNNAPGPGAVPPPFGDLSPSDRTVLIGFDNAVKKLNIQTSINHIISPITPSIIVTGVPKEDGQSDDHFPQPSSDRHRSSIYSRPTAAVPQFPFTTGSAGSTPPVPVIPHDLLDPGNIHSSSSSSRSRSAASSWSTDLEDGDDRSLTFVGSYQSEKDDINLKLIEQESSVPTPLRSQGWWNEITTPFLKRSGTVRTKASNTSSPRPSPLPQPSPVPSLQPSPQPSSDGSKLTTENVAALERGVPVSEATTPHPADEKRATIGFFGEATPKTAIFPDVPPIPPTVQDRAVMSPEFVDAGAFGEAAEYYHACLHDAEGEEPYFRCENHDCSLRDTHQGVSDERQREIFNASFARESAGASRGNRMAGGGMVAGAAAGALTGAAIGLAAHHLHQSSDAGSGLSRNNAGHHVARTPSINGYVDPSDSVSQVAERSFRAETARAMSPAPPLPPPKTPSEAQRTMTTDSVGSPEVVEATAVPLVRAVSRESTIVAERAVREADPVPPMPHLASARAVPGPAPATSVLPSAIGVAKEMPALAPSQAASAPHSEAARSRPARTALAPTPTTLPMSNTVTPYEEIGVARSVPSPEPAPTRFAETSRAISPAQEAEPETTAPPPAPAASGSRNPFRRVPVPLRTEMVPDHDEGVSPGALTPNMAHHAEVGTAVPMQAPRSIGSDAASVVEPVPAAAPVGLTHRGVLERYDQRRSPPTQEAGTPDVNAMPSEAHRAAPPIPPMAPAFGPMPGHSNRGLAEPYSEKPAQAKQKRFAKFGVLLARWKEKRNKNRKPRTKEQKKKRRMCCGIFCCLLMMVILILVLVLTLTIPRHDMSVQSSWLNLTDFPPLPTGVATIARPNAVREQSGCVAPSTMWSCAVPREDQDGIKPNAPNQPNFRIELRFKNDSRITNGTLAQSRNSRRDLLVRDAFTDNLYSPSPAPPSIDDQKFLGNTTDHNSGTFEGEETPFFISFLPTSNAGTSFLGKRQDDSSSGGSTPSSTVSSSPSSSTSSPSSTSTGASSAADLFPNITSVIPKPAINPDGSAASANLYPLPSAQPLRLYNRGKSDEHYGFYTYFDRSIFLTSASLANHSYSYNGADVPGGASENTASLRCTWAQTRFLVQIWTRKDAGSTQLINGSTTAEAAAQGNITKNSQSTWSQPGSFPYPVTLTLDRHGGDAKQKMLYCYGMDGNRVNATTGKISFEDRGFGGTLVNPVGSFFAAAAAGGDGGDVPAKATAAAGGIDGGTGGCGCTWQNWQQTGASAGNSGGGSGSGSSSSASTPAAANQRAKNARRRFDFW